MLALMIKATIHRCGFLLLLLYGLSLTTQAKDVKIESAQGDIVTLGYTLKYDYGANKVTISFGNNVIINLDDNQSKRYEKLRDGNALKVVFVDGNNFKSGINVETESGNTTVKQISPCKLPAGDGWRVLSSGTNVFVINDTGKQEISMSLGQQKGKLEIPIYLAEYNYQPGSKGIFGLGAREPETTYKVFRQCGPLVIELKPKREDKKAQAGGDTTYKEELQEIEELLDAIEDSGTSNSCDEAAQELIKTIRPQLRECQGKIAQEALDGYDALEPSINQLLKMQSEASPAIQDKIDEIKSEYDKGREEAQKAIASIESADEMALQQLKELASRLDSCQWSWSYLVKPFDEIDDIKERYDRLSGDYNGKVSVAVWNQISAFHDRIKQKEKQLKPYLVARNIIRGLLGFIAIALSLFGYNRWKNVLEQRKMKRFEEIQRRMVTRAENEAERRTRSYTQNKTRQLVGKARNKGRQAVQSQAKELGNRVRGQKSSSGNTPSTGDASATKGTSRPPIGRFSGSRSQPNRRPKPGGNGEITI